MSSILFTAWGYEVSILETIAALTSLVGVWLGTTGKRITWPWWAISSALYGIFFYQANLMGSAALQIVFIIAAVLGWMDWAPTGAKPGKLSQRFRIYWLVGFLAAWVALAPLLSRIGAAATWVDSFLFVGSLIAQILMVLEKYESWPLWLVVDAVGTALYAQQGYWFTSLLYFIFTVIAIIGWKNWYESRSSTH
jgi:nicotinamide mononucleotide transporter